MRRHLIILLALILTARVYTFEVPYPQSSTEIRRSIVKSSSSSIVTQQLTLGSGTKAEVISCLGNDNIDFFSSLFGVKKSTNDKKPVLAFVHGSFHASWCWTENYMPYFASLGYPCVALSLQGTGGTPTVEMNAKKVKIESHVADLDAFLTGLSDTDPLYNLGFELGENPQVVVLGHSFGGLSIMKWLEKYHSEREDTDTNNQHSKINLFGVALLCSVPPSGNGPMTMRFLKRSLKDSWKITAGFVLKKAITDKEICRDLFFGTEDDNGISDADIQRYQSYFERDTVATIDLNDLSKKLPSAKIDKETGSAPFVDQLPPSFVIAASDDFVVDEEGSRETARFLGIGSGPVTIDSPHDIMLGDKWRNGADAILAYLQGL